MGEDPCGVRAPRACLSALEMACKRVRSLLGSAVFASGYFEMEIFYEA